MKETEKRIIEAGKKQGIPEHKIHHWWNSLAKKEKKAIHNVFVKNPVAPVQVMTAGLSGGAIIGIASPALGSLIGGGSIFAGMGLWGYQMEKEHKKEMKKLGKVI